MATTKFKNREGAGALFPNDKGDNDKRPDFRGDVTIGGKVYDISAWTKTGNKGKFISLQLTDKALKGPATVGGKDNHDDIPF